MMMPNGAAAWIGIELGARAGVHAAVSACASSAEAIGDGMQMIRSGRADVVVAGGAEAAIVSLSMAAFAVMRALSLRNSEPERASRPFDKARDGFVLGEGAAWWCWSPPRTPRGGAHTCTPPSRAWLRGGRVPPRPGGT
jgi:3-oxoacyl-[acyl-carrier-protein] synthase II